MLRKIAIGLVGLLSILTVGILVNYSTWKAENHERLRSASQIAETRVGKIEYKMDGEQGPILLFLHGTPGGYDQAPDRSSGYRILTPSRPGYLSTSIEIGPTPAEQAHSYAALLDELGLDRVTVMGASGGGPSAISFAALYPERTRGLVAMEAVSQSMELLRAPSFMKSDFLVWLTFGALKRVVGSEGIIKFMIPDPANQELVLGNPSKTKKIESILWSFWPPSRRQVGMDNDNQQFTTLNLPLGDIRVPTLIFHGTADVDVPFSHAELLAEKIPGAILHAISDADHMMPFSHDEEVQAVLAEFLNGLDD